jgi:ribosomal protein S24E
MKLTLSLYNPLLHRYDVVANKSYPSNPGYDVVKEDVAKYFKKTIECVVIKSIKGSFGSSEFVIEARVYDSSGDLQSTEPKPKIKKVEGDK